jgi:hypothetical protein
MLVYDSIWDFYIREDYIWDCFIREKFVAPDLPTLFVSCIISSFKNTIPLP